MSSGQNMVIKRKANEFCIWRAGTAVGWDCTAQDLAQETGLNSSTVRRICRYKGWELVSSRSTPDRWDVCRHIAHGHAATE